MMVRVGSACRYKEGSSLYPSSQVRYEATPKPRGKSVPSPLTHHVGNVINGIHNVGRGREPL